MRANDGSGDSGGSNGSPTSGQIDIGAALAALNAKGSPMAAELLGSLSLTNDPEPAAPVESPAPSTSARRRWLGTSIVVGGLAVASLLAAFGGPVDPPRAIEPASLAHSPPEAPLLAEAPAPIAHVAAAAIELPPEAPTTAAPIEAATLVIDEPPAALRVVAPALVEESPLPAVEVVELGSPVEEVAFEEAPIEEAPAPRSIDDLLVAAVPVEAEVAPAPVALVTRDVPTESDVAGALDSVRAAVSACTPVHAVAALRLTLDGATGRVRGVYVDGVFAGTPAGSCIARSVRRARVDPFSESTFTLSYQYLL